MPSYSPWDMTLRGPQANLDITYGSAATIRGPQADLDITYGSAIIMKDLPPHPSRQTPIINPPIILAASIQPTPRDFYVFPS